MSFASEQTGSGIQPDPARAWQIDLAPGVQVGEIDIRTRRPVERLDIGLELNEVARHEPRRHAQMPQQLHQQPRGVTARARCVLQGELRGLNARFHADQVSDVLAQALVETDQKVDGRNRLATDAVQIRLKSRGQRQFFEVRRQLALLFAGVGERDVLGVGLEEEVERIEHSHLGDQIDFDAKLVGLFREDQARQVIALRVLLPVDEMVFRQDFQRIRQHACAAMGGRAQANDLRTQFDRAVVAIMRDMVQGNMNRHGVPPASLNGN